MIDHRHTVLHELDQARHQTWHRTVETIEEYDDVVSGHGTNRAVLISGCARPASADPRLAVLDFAQRPDCRAVAALMLAAPTMYDFVCRIAQCGNKEAKQIIEAIEVFALADPMTTDQTTLDVKE